MSQIDQSRAMARRYTDNAPRYLRHWASVLLGPGLKLVEGLALGSGERVLEVAAGTGRLLPHIAESTAGGQVVATDLSEGMIGLAPSQFPRLVADATRLPIRSERFDVVLMAFALFHVLTPDRALAEMVRVLAPDGRIGVAVWAEDEESPAEQLFMRELDAMEVPAVEPHPTSAARMNTEDKLAGILADAGLGDIRTQRLEIVDRIDVDEFIERRTHLGLTADRYNLLQPERRPAFLARLRSVIESGEPEDLTSIEIPLMGWGRKPR